MKTIAIYSNKGGVGKTTAAVNLAYYASLQGYKTLIFDLDPQSSTTFYFRVRPKVKPKARGLFRSPKAIENSIKGSDYPGLDLLPADFSHRNLDIIFDSLRRKKYRLEIVLNIFQFDYDIVILDCPPTINILAENIFNAADYLLTPLIPTTLSIRAFQMMNNFLRDNHYDPQKVISFLSMVDDRNKLHLKTSSLLEEKINGLLQTHIPLLPEIELMGLKREPVGAFAPQSRGAQAFQSLWWEINQGVLTR